MTNNLIAPSPPDDWQPSPPGELSQLGRRLRAQRSRRQFLKAAGGALAGVVAVSGGAMAWRSLSHSDTSGELTCAEASALMTPLLAGQLPADEERRVRSHIERCAHCRQMFDEASKRTKRSGLACRRSVDC